MNKFRKFMAYITLVILYSLIFVLCGLNSHDWIYWIIMFPILIGLDWIVEKLDKIK